MHIWNILIVAAGSCYVVQSLQRSLSSNGRSSAGNNDDNQNSCSRSLETPIGRWLHKPSRRCFKDSRHGSKHNVMKRPIQSECIVCDRSSSSIYSDAKEDVQSHFLTMKPYCNYTDAVDSHALLCSEVSSRFLPILSNFNTVRPQERHAFFLSMQSLRSPTQDSLKELPCFMSSLYSRDVIHSSQIHANSFKGIAKFKRDRSPFEIYENAVSLNIANKSWCRDQLEDAVCSLCSKEEKPCAWKISRSKDTMLYEENGSNSNGLTEIERCLLYFCPNLSLSVQNKSCAQRCHEFKQESAIDYANVGVPCERQLHQHEEMHGNEKNPLDRFIFNFGVGIGIMFAILSDKTVKANEIGHLEGSLYTSKCLDQDEAHGRMNLNRTILGNNKNITLTEQNDISNARLIQDVLSSVEQIKGSLMRDLEPTSDTDNQWAQRMAKVEAELEIELKRMENILDHEAATSSRDTNESCIKTLKDKLGGYVSPTGDPETHACLRVHDCSNSSLDASLLGGCGAVQPEELERRLYQVLESRQEERIVELEAEVKRLDAELQVKEQEFRAWKQRIRNVLHDADLIGLVHTQDVPFCNNGLDYIGSGTCEKSLTYTASTPSFHSSQSMMGENRRTFDADPLMVYTKSSPDCMEREDTTYPPIIFSSQGIHNHDIIELYGSYSQSSQLSDYSTYEAGSNSSDLDEEVSQQLIKRIVEKGKKGALIVEVAQSAMASFDVDGISLDKETT